MIPFGLTSLMTLSLPITRRTAKCLVSGASAIYWLNETDGQTLVDSSGNGRDGYLGTTTGADANDPTRTAAGLSFGGNDCAVLGANPFSLFASAGNPWTVQVAVTPPDADNMGVLAKAGSTAGSRTFHLYVTADKYVCILRGTSTTTDVAAPAAPTLVTVTWDGTAATLATGTGAPVALGVGVAAEETTEAILLGARTLSSPAGYLNGGVAHAVLAYPFALTAAQRVQNHTSIAGLLATRGVALA